MAISSLKRGVHVEGTFAFLSISKKIILLFSQEFELSMSTSLSEQQDRNFYRLWRNETVYKTEQGFENIKIC